MAKVKTTVWDAAEHLDSEEAMDEYLEAALEEGEPALVAAVMDDIARAALMLRQSKNLSGE